jgi:transposase-like protein
MEKSRLTYRVWLWAIYLVATDKRGISAMELMRQLHVTYKTAWYLLHRIREAMGNADENCLLQGIVELDDGFFGGSKGGGTSGRGSKKIKVLVAVSKDKEGRPQRLKMRVVPNVKGKTVGDFARASIAEQSIVETDAYSSYQKPLAGKYNHSWQVYDANSEMLAWLHTIISNAKALINGTFHGLDSKYFQRYLNEFVYRFNRRFQQASLFDRLLTCVLGSPPLGLVVLKR